ncbi:hypothetical protein ASG31_05455 [Chryseobacterium sp. Leaf404]|uniref:hypothetical protein n=1 Tax=unclassified Chryseobacterium TaxID=2593645 RepID=UPI0006FF8CD3|nr:MULTISPECIES: hypothetical protein [unclassified Chryseobacterium]KQT18180.1 hypothetical protein ASG31_05455 [Chryseobacterium sp. Leaf404]
MIKTFQILNIVALIVTVFVNYLSNTGFFNDETMASISGKYQNLFTPAGYAFSIWGLIYLLLFGFVLYFGPFTKNTGDKENTVRDTGWWFVVSCVANCLWIVTWLYEYTFLTIPVMIVLLTSLMKIILNNKGTIEAGDLKTLFFLRLPFYIYSGWISVALIADVAAYLKKIEWSGFGISETIWTVIMFVAAAGIHLYMLWKRDMISFVMVAVWALVAIAAANKNLNGTVYYFAISTSVFLALNAVIKVFTKKSAV